MTMKDGLAPLVDEKSRILVLGTLPGDESLRQQRYYANTRNQFWSLLEHAFGGTVGGAYEQRVRYLAAHAIALWYVLETVNRPGSSHSAITEAVPNDFAKLFGKFPLLRYVAFNGGKAETLWRRHVGPQSDVPHRSFDCEAPFVKPNSSEERSPAQGQNGALARSLACSGELQARGFE